MKRFAALAAALGLMACSPPWTVRPIGDDRESNSRSVAPAAYATSVWSPRLLPAMLKAAVDAQTLLDALHDSVDTAGQKYGHREGPGAWYFVMRGRGVVLAENFASRVRTIDVDIAPFDGKPDVSLEIGPVLRGTSVRDATGLVRFNDFSTQLQYADAGNALNDIVLKSVLNPVASQPMRGRTVDFIATFAAQAPWRPPVRDAIPIQFAVYGNRP